MATTNALQWNPTAANQENDAQYAADSQRAGGATNPSVFQAELANKLFYQLSTYVTALFSAFAAKGFTTSDSNLPTLTAQCGNFLTTGDNIAVHSSGGGPLVSATQVGPTYGSTPTTAAIEAITQGSSTGNFLFSGIDSIGVPRFSVRADGLVSALSVALTGVLTTVSAVVSGLLQAASLSISGNATVTGSTTTGTATVSGALTSGSFRLASGAPNGSVLTGDGTNFVAMTPASSASGNGYTTLPGGVLMQWVQGAVDSGSANPVQTLSFPTPFASAVYSIQVTPTVPSGIDTTNPMPYAIISYTLTTVTIERWRRGDNGPQDTQPYVLAIGK